MLYIGYNQTKAPMDLNIPSMFNGKLIVFSHGYMGFKDWGAWALVQNYFLNLGFGFCKFNFSHNGTSIDRPNEFCNLENFSLNTYWKEKQDLISILNLIRQKVKPFPEIYLIGHSQGGAISLLLATDHRVKKIVTWAAVAELGSRFPQGPEFELWKEEGVRYRLNSRTNQEMPIRFSVFEEFLKYQKEVDVERHLHESQIPMYFLHGSYDTSVLPSEMRLLELWSKQPGEIIEGANHTFGSHEPWEHVSLPKHLLQVCKKTAAFLLKSH